MTADELEVDGNFEVFLARLPELLKQRPAEFALMHAGEIVDFLPSSGAALRAGHERFGEGPFSVQEVTDRPVDLGFFSHAINTRIAEQSSTSHRR